MPLYDVKCPDCGYKDELFIKLEDFEKNLPPCPICGTLFNRVITPTQIQPDIQPYKSMVTGEMITSRSRHKQHLKDHNCIEVGNESLQPKEKSSTDMKREQYALRKQIAEIMDSKGL